jgi:hypothetical protein
MLHLPTGWVEFSLSYQKLFVRVDSLVLHEIRLQFVLYNRRTAVLRVVFADGGHCRGQSVNRSIGHGGTRAGQRVRVGAKPVEEAESKVLRTSSKTADNTGSWIAWARRRFNAWRQTPAKTSFASAVRHQTHQAVLGDLLVHNPVRQLAWSLARRQPVCDRPSR